MSFICCTTTHDILQIKYRPACCWPLQIECEDSRAVRLVVRASGAGRPVRLLIAFSSLSHIAVAE